MEVSDAGFSARWSSIVEPPVGDRQLIAFDHDSSFFGPDHGDVTAKFDSYRPVKIRADESRSCTQLRILVYCISNERLAYRSRQDPSTRSLSVERLVTRRRIGAHRVIAGGAQ